MKVPSLESVTTINRDGSRRFIHPVTASGRFTNWRTAAAVVLMAVYVLLPWIPINGNPAVFLDIANRQFHLFGLTLAPQDLWLGFFLITGTGFTLFFLTALLGRVWCGWACPQTVFLDIIRRFERWIEGDAQARRQLDAAPWSTSKVVKRVAKHATFALFALLLAHVFMSYFVSLPKLYAMMHHAPTENWGVFLFVFLMAGALWFDFAWFREQFCIVLCPYGRLQSVLMDSDTVSIGYDSTRGEPRGKKGTQGAGDCVDCAKCVQVCPTGIDIRQGVQLECIACAACIDACDSVMDKLRRPRGLIRYDSPNGLSGGKTRLFRPRIILYLVLMAAGFIAMTVSVSTFRPATVTTIRMVGAPYYLDNGQVRNQFMLRVINKRNQAVTFQVSVLNPPEGLLWAGPDAGLSLAPLSEQMTPLIVTLPREKFHGEFPIRVQVRSSDGKFSFEKELPFLGPSAP